MGVPNNGWWKIPLKRDDLGVSLFQETTIWMTFLRAAETGRGSEADFDEACRAKPWYWRLAAKLRRFQVAPLPMGAFSGKCDLHVRFLYLPFHDWMLLPGPFQVCPSDCKPRNQPFFVFLKPRFCLVESACSQLHMCLSIWVLLVHQLQIYFQVPGPPAGDWVTGWSYGNNFW